MEPTGGKERPAVLSSPIKWLRVAQSNLSEWEWGCDLLKPLKDELMALEGDTVTLSCKYSGSVRYFYWYQQKSRLSPQFLIKEYSEVTEKTTDTSTELTITKLTLADTALYYCAVDTHAVFPATRHLPVAGIQVFTCSKQTTK
uniref:Ig-like domain-containing protein n=1 Tax=Oryzias latipes TaxID=8090 RepID=A0A3B3I7J7_ORYLA